MKINRSNRCNRIGNALIFQFDCVATFQVLASEMLWEQGLRKV